MARVSQQLRSKDTSHNLNIEVGTNEQSTTDEHTQDADYDEPTAMPPRKRARRAVSQDTGSKKQRMPEEFRKVRGKRGLLEKLAKDVPLDVILEIFYYLDPSDLLRLARSSKDLRRILMSKSSESVWRTCRFNIEGLPPLPEDLNEPQYAHLLFEPYCHLCTSNGRCDNVLWTFRIRCCKTCMKDRDIFPLLGDLLSAGEFGSRLHLVPIEEVTYPRRSSIVCITYGRVAEAMQEEYQALKGNDARNEWSTRMTKKRRIIDEHARLCQAWHKSELAHRAEELGRVASQVRSQRKAAILDRLGEIGWREEAELVAGTQGDPDPFTGHKLVRQSKKLTEHGWNGIKTELVEFLSDCKEQRLAEERRNILGSRYERLEKLYYELRSTMDVQEPFPAMGDLLLGFAVDHLVWNTPIDQELTDDVLYSTLSEYASDTITIWRTETEQMLLDVLQEAVPTATASDLPLAITVFKCHDCGSALQYPQMFYHRCCMCTPVHEQSAFEHWQMYYDHGTTAPKGPWQTSTLSYDADLSQLIYNVVKACHLDPARASVQDLYAANPLSECLTCDSGQRNALGPSGIENKSSVRSFMRWPLPLHHAGWYSTHKITTNSFGEETDLICAAEPMDSFMGCSDVESVHCAHCHKLLTVGSLPHHLKDIHGVTLNSGSWYWSPLCHGRDIRKSFEYYTPMPVDGKQ